VNHSPLTIWCNRLFSPALTLELEQRLAPHRIVWAIDRMESNLFPALRDVALVHSCNVAWGQPDLKDCVESTTLGYIQLTTAGYTRYDRDDFKSSLRAKSIAFCNASGVYDEPCAQHVLAMMLALARQLPAAYHSQRNSASWPYLPLRSASKILGYGQHVLLVGYGAIACRLAELLKPFDLKITALRRTVRGDEIVPTQPIADLDALLPTADHIVNILPASAETKNMFNIARLSNCKQGAILYNIGRGDTVDQDALIHVLTHGPLAHAYLDVTTPEPLPSDHPLWHLPNCYITPHTAGGSADETRRQIEHFVDNLTRFAQGKPLRDRIV
jgi:phosphoglycerate dehydrogenase-like enzyme